MMGDAVERWRWQRDVIVWQRWWTRVGVELMLPVAHRQLLPLLLLRRMSVVYYNSVTLTCSLLMSFLWALAR
jgi:hypothetical protein